MSRVSKLSPLFVSSDCTAAIRVCPSLPSSIVEPMIALSITYVAIENLFTSTLRPWRLGLVFAFGLLHGMGFAGVLKDLGLPRSEFLTALLTFNVGVEAGQLAVIALASLATTGARAERVAIKVGPPPARMDLLKAGSIHLIIYTTTGALSFEDEKSIRRAAVRHRVPCITTMSGARAAVEAVASKQRDPIRVWSLQEIHQ